MSRILNLLLANHFRQDLLDLLDIGLLHALASLGVAPSEALFVGDEDADAGAAAAAGVAFARVDAATTAADAVRTALTESGGADAEAGCAAETADASMPRSVATPS